MFHIFVYGSLRKGMINHNLLNNMDAKYIGDYKTIENYYMIGLKSKSYPYVIEENINNDLIKSPIYGEVYTISNEDILYLDGLEGHPYNYIREKINVISETNSINAYMYILRNEEMLDAIKTNFGKRFIAVPGNDWKKFLER